MSNYYNRNLLPKINSKARIYNNVYKPKKIFSVVNTNINQKEIIYSLKSLKEKKPGTSINTKKPYYILPEIPVKKLAKTANIKTNYNNNNNEINDDKNKNINEDKKNNEQNKEKTYYEKISDMALILLENDEELKKLFNELYRKNVIEDKNKWLNDNIFKREVFWTILEFYFKKNLDVKEFIKKEIRKKIKNKILDNTLSNSLKMIQFQYNEYINNIHKI